MANKSTQWKKGQSGNPKGRPPSDLKLREIAQEHTIEAIERLVFWMRSDDPAASTKATSYLLDRGWGKPRQEVELSGDSITGITVTIEKKCS